MAGLLLLLLLLLPRLLIGLLEAVSGKAFKNLLKTYQKPINLSHFRVWVGWGHYRLDLAGVS